MFRQFKFKSMCFVTCVCALGILTGYRYLNIGDHQTTGTMILQNHIISESRSYADTILDMTRMMVKTEMWDYNYSHSGVDKLEDLVMESGGTPVRSIIVSTWRSGSSFFGELISAEPGTFYSYESLMMCIINQIRGPPNAARATNLIKSILKCDYKSNTDFVNYFTYAKQYLIKKNRYIPNARLWEKCKYKRELCYDGDFISKFCKLFPFQVMKLVRFRLPLVQNKIDEKELNVKVILLVRDPRAVMESRRHIKNFCKITELVADCDEPRLVCSDMVKDYKSAVIFAKKYPDRFTIQRYEDLAFSLKESTLKLLKFLTLDPTQSIHEFLKMHTNDSTDPFRYSTFRVTKNIPFKWTKTMEFDAVNEIQEKCREAMSLWGYELAHNASHLASKNFNPLLPYSVNQNLQNVFNI